MEIKQLLQLVKEGKMSIHEAEKLLKKLPYEDLDFAKLDHHRNLSVKKHFPQQRFLQAYIQDTD